MRFKYPLISFKTKISHNLIMFLIPFSFLLVFTCPLFLFPSNAADYYVDATAGKDSNPGSQPFPFKTISAAVDKVFAGDTVWINSGTYRETISLLRSGSGATSPISFRATSGANVEIKGSDLVTGWILHSGSIWKKLNWNINSQQVFADSSPLRQIGRNCPFNTIAWGDSFILPPLGSGLTDMIAGSFYYNPAENTLYVWLSDGSNPNNHQMEASVRDFIIPPYVLQYIGLYGLRFSHSNLSSKTTLLGMVNIFGNSWIVSNCFFLYSDSAGLNITGEGHKILNNAANYNGCVGISINGSDAAHNWAPYQDRSPQNIELVGNETSYNNYRKFQANWQGAGIKGSTSCNSVTINQHKSFSNYGVGIWFDIFCKNISINRCVVSTNQAGIGYEISDKAIISNNLVTNNLFDGISISASNDVSIFNNTLDKNGYGIVIHGMPRSEHPTLQNNTIRNNIISGSQILDLVIYNNPPAAANNNSDYNLFFQDEGYVKIGYLNTPEYQLSYNNLKSFSQNTGNDTHSRNADPLWKDGSSGNYTLQAGSPAIDSGTLQIDGIGDKDLNGSNRIIDATASGNPVIDIGAYEYIISKVLAPPKSLRIIP